MALLMPDTSARFEGYFDALREFGGLSLVVVWPTFLWQSRVTSLERSGLAAGWWRFEDWGRVREQLQLNPSCTLFVSPHCLSHPRWWRILRSLSVSSVVVEDVHQVSSWDPEGVSLYRLLPSFLRSFPRVPRVFTTSGCALPVRREVLELLPGQHTGILSGQWEHRHLFLEVVKKELPLEQLISFVSRRRGEAGIVFCRSLRHANRIAKMLRQAGYGVACDDEGLERSKCLAQRHLFLGGAVSLFATVTGLRRGVERRDVRFVVYLDTPLSLSQYWRELDGVGLDGEPAHVLMLYGESDLARKPLIGQEAGERWFRFHQQALVGFVETKGCRRRSIARFLGEDLPDGGCGMCDVCWSQEEEATDLTLQAQKLCACLHRMGGATLEEVCDVLLGAKTPELLRAGHDSLTTYGIGKEWTRPQWESLVEILIEKRIWSFSRQDRTCTLNPGGWEVMRGLRQIWGRARRPVGDVF